MDVAPRYSGSDKSRVSAAQVVDYAMANGFFVSTTRGIGYGNSFGVTKAVAVADPPRGADKKTICHRVINHLSRRDPALV